MAIVTDPKNYVLREDTYKYSSSTQYDNRNYIFPSPTTYNIKYADIDSPNAGRSDSGYMNRERLRHDVASISLEWIGLTTSQLNEILNHIMAQSFDIVFLTGTLNNVNRYSSKTFYAGDRNTTMLLLGKETYWNLSVNLIEI